MAFTRAIGATYVPSQIVPPQPLREFRGAWIPTVGNIDWPSKAGLSTAQQQSELISLLDGAAQLKLNVVILQVRPACDALYASSFEPWSEYLTGTMGKSPRPFYDPLAFAIQQAHQRGLELHAWFNPFRARHTSERSAAAPSHVTRAHSQWVRPYGQQLWLDPGEREVQDYCLSVILDVVRRYDIDGVHLDDYFYPYPEKDRSGIEVDFPDDSTWKRFAAGRGSTRDDWRRENVNSFVHRLYQSIKAAKPWVKFGISPFGIWRPGSPAPVRGFDAYAKLYADSRKWLVNGWVDYFAPQLYWSIDSPEQSFSALLSWWAQQNVNERQLVPGLDATKTISKWRPQEIINQIRLARRLRGIAGHVHWDLKTLTQNAPLTKALQGEVYAEPALVRALPSSGNTAPFRPQLRAEPTKPGRPLRFNWLPGGAEKPRLWLLQTCTRGKWKTEILASELTARSWNSSPPDIICLTAIDRSGHSSPAAVLQRQNR